jgi:hypothetical protein
MRHVEAELDHWLEHHPTPSECRDTLLARDIQLAREASSTPSLRRRVGEAVIAFGVRLAGETGSVREERRLVTRPT